MPFAFTIVIGISACAIVCYFGFRHLRLLLWLNARGAKTTGIVVREVIESGGKGGPLYFPVVRFMDRSGVSREFRSRFAAGRSIVGDQLPVVYDIANPEKQSEALRWRSIISEIFVAAFLVVVTVGITSGVIWASHVEMANQQLGEASGRPSPANPSQAPGAPHP